LNTVERRKIRSGSSAALDGEPGHSSKASASSTHGRHLKSYWLKASDVMMISAKKASLNVMTEVAAGRFERHRAGSRLTECEAFLLRVV
jgi:hypothetical protein